MIVCIVLVTHDWIIAGMSIGTGVPVTVASECILNLILDHENLLEVGVFASTYRYCDE